jgi:altronate hydrolase
MKKINRLHERDNVAVALADIGAGDSLFEHLRVTEKIPAGHKVALANIKAGEEVIKYGNPIGKATRLIEAGELVHVHNLHSDLARHSDYTYSEKTISERAGNDPESLSFPAYLRKNGKIGIRNEVWIINTVGCCNRISERLSNLSAKRYRDRNFDGVYHFPHPYGCSQLGEDLENTQKILAGLVRHPNAAAVLVLGLGCENNHIASFRKVVGEKDNDRVRWLNAQDVEDEIEAGMQLLDELVNYAGTFHREPVPLAKLILGLKCGGSDSFSGITANPIVGRVTDYFTGMGASAILTEVPEMFGAETILMERCRSREVFNQTVSLINNFKDYFSEQGQQIYENPSPGNRAGGITTLEEKSLGCILKGGEAPVNSVLAYGGVLEKNLGGLHILDGPGNDLVAVTALAAAGSHLVLFTTGRGTPLGGPVPVVKIASNSELAGRKKNWVDFDAGRLLSGSSAEWLSKELAELVLSVAAGERKTRSEEDSCREIAIFKKGVTL